MFFQHISGYIVTSVLLLKLFGVQCSSSPYKVDERIIGGKTINISQAPYTMQLWADVYFICGGTLTRPRYVITAAHCCDDVTAEQMTVTGGATKLTDPGVTRKVKQIMMDPLYNSTTLEYDVAVLWLEEPMFGPHIACIPLNNIPIMAGTIIQVTGWGRTQQNSYLPSNDLRTIKVPILSRTECENCYKKYKIGNTMFCAGWKDNTQDACSGDSGGPAVSNNTLLGVVSWGIGCAQPGQPGVYHGVRSRLSFIKKSMNEV